MKNQKTAVIEVLGKQTLDKGSETFSVPVLGYFGGPEFKHVSLKRATVFSSYAAACSAAEDITGEKSTTGIYGDSSAGTSFIATCFPCAKGRTVKA